MNSITLDGLESVEGVKGMTNNQDDQRIAPDKLEAMLQNTREVPLPLGTKLRPWCPNCKSDNVHAHLIDPSLEPTMHPDPMIICYKCGHMW